MENQAQATSQPFSELLALIDDRTWIWNFVIDGLQKASHEFVRLSSDTPIRPSWRRFKDAERIIIHWENKTRSGGAIVEEILDIDPSYNVGERVIILSTSPTREDVVYINELNLNRLIKLRNRESDIKAATAELLKHISQTSSKNEIEAFWREMQNRIDSSNFTLPLEQIEQTADQVTLFVAKFPNEKRTAKYLDVMALLEMMRGDHKKAKEYWEFALEVNPNFHRGYNNLVHFYTTTRRYDDAFNLMQKMHELNRANIMRMVKMGNVKKELADLDRAEHYYNLALERDQFCSGALNGLAEVYFLRGDVEGSRKLIAKSHLAEQLATRLNRIGIELVKTGNYGEALDHYTKAQYVLPQQDKGPMLFYNIGLCYAKWGRYHLAREFLRIALVKDPNYRKAQELLERVMQKDVPAAS